MKVIYIIAFIILYLEIAFKGVILESASMIDNYINIIFYDLFTMPFSFTTLGLAGNVLEFIGIVKDAIIENILIIAILSIPLILLSIIDYSKWTCTL